MTWSGGGHKMHLVLSEWNSQAAYKISQFGENVQ